MALAPLTMFRWRVVIVNIPSYDSCSNKATVAITIQKAVSKSHRMANNHSETERRLWAAADEFRANSELKSSEYATPVLGLIFLRYADHRFTLAEKELVGKGPSFKNIGRRIIGKEDYQAKGFPFGMPRSDNANYLWIQLFYSSLNATGRAGFVMANSAADARQSEMEIRKKLLQSHAVDVMVAIGPNFFYTVTLPCTLWFFDKSKSSLPVSGSPRPASGRGAGGGLMKMCFSLCFSYP